MAAFSTQVSIAADPGFVNACEQAARAAAIAISYEATTTPNHANRVAFARIVLTAAPGVLGPMLARNVATDASITGTSVADATIATVVSAIWTAIAGAA